MNEESITDLRAELKAARKASKHAAGRGRYNWGDDHRNARIKELQRKIQTLKTNTGIDSQNEIGIGGRAAAHLTAV